MASSPDVDAVPPQQREVLALAAQGRTVKETAALLGLNAETVKSYRTKGMTRLGVYRAIELVPLFPGKPIPRARKNLDHLDADHHALLRLLSQGVPLPEAQHRLGFTPNQARWIVRRAKRLLDAPNYIGVAHWYAHTYRTNQK